jgi:hypothetical protein
MADTLLRNAPEPFVLFSEHINELLDEAKNFLDGTPVETEGQAEAVSRLLNMIRKASNDADEARKIEKKPHDDAAKAVQSKWKPLLDAADLAATTCKRALEPFLHKKEEAQRAAAEAARQEAERKAAFAREAAEKAANDDLGAKLAASVAMEDAIAAEKLAGRLDKAKAHATGGERAIGLRTSYSADILDPIAFGKWAWGHRREEYLAFLTSLAISECRHGPRDLPGVRITTERKAV